MITQSLSPYRSELSTVVGETATALNRGTLLETTMDNFLLQALIETTGAPNSFFQRMALWCTHHPWDHHYE